jgi:DNA recombination protein RmuC
MDVKFPLAAYMRMLDAPGERERAVERATFLQDVRARVRELAAREYQEQGPATVDYVLLFLPNETISAFVHEHDPALVEDALGRKVVLCSPITLFALLGVIRQAFDNFVVEQTSDRILALLGTFRSQWVKFGHSLDRVKSRLDSVQREVDQLTGPRRRQLERPLEQIDELRRQRGVTAPVEPVPEPLTEPPAGAPSSDPPPPPPSRHGVLVPNEAHP